MKTAALGHHGRRQRGRSEVGRRGAGGRREGPCFCVPCEAPGSCAGGKATGWRGRVGRVAARGASRRPTPGGTSHRHQAVANAEAASRPGRQPAAPLTSQPAGRRRGRRGCRQQGSGTGRQPTQGGTSRQHPAGTSHRGQAAAASQAAGTGHFCIETTGRGPVGPASRNANRLFGADGAPSANVRNRNACVTILFA